MTRRIVGSTCAAAVLTVTVAAAQATSPAPTQAPTPGNQQRPAERTATPSPRIQSDQQVTLTGCVVREGASDFVLASAVPSGPSANVSGGVTGSTSAGAIGTTGTSTGAVTAGVGATGTSTSRYRLSGERDLAEYVGQRVEIVGRTDATAARTTGNASTGSAGIGARTDSGVGTPAPSAPTSAAGATSDSTPGAASPTAAANPSNRGVTAGQTAAMQHVTITSVRALGGTCQ